MLNVEGALSNDRLLRALTGLNRNAFEDLCLAFEVAYQADLNADLRPRRRARGGGRKARLQSPWAKLFFILFYFKCYPTFDVLGFLFGMERGRAHRWVHRCGSVPGENSSGHLPLQRILEETLGEKMMLPERKLESLEQFLQRFPEVTEIIIDGTERPIQRPQNAQKQKENYSGKKKRHSRKQITGSTPKKRVVLLTKARAGRIHDKRQLDEENLICYIPSEVKILGDLGFQGLQNEYVNVHLPKKKPKGKSLSAYHKDKNKKLSRQRVVCEHAHAGIKRYNAVSAVYRNHVTDFDDHLMLTATGLWNFYLDAA
jgi:hypothetical protein